MIAFWRVWAALNTTKPIDNVYLHLIQRGNPKRRRVTFSERFFAYAPYIFLALSCSLTLMGQSMGLFAFMVMIVFPIFVVFGAGIFIGLVLAFRVSYAVVLERQQRRDEVLAVTPMGAVGVIWFIVLLIYRRSALIPRVLDFTRDLLQAAFYLCVALGVVVVAVLLFDTMPSSSVVELTIGAFTFVSAIYADMMQSAVLGALVGLTVPAYTRDAFSARFLSVGLFLALQVLVYIVALVISVWLPTLILGEGGVVGAFVLNGGRLLALIGTRQLLIVLFWVSIPRLYESDLQEWRQAVGV